MMNANDNDRRLRVQYPNALYHLTSRGVERRQILLDDGDRQRFFDCNFNRRWRGSGHLLEGRFRGKIVENESYACRGSVMTNYWRLGTVTREALPRLTGPSSKRKYRTPLVRPLSKPLMAGYWAASHWRRASGS